MTADEKIAVIRAQEEGKTVEQKYLRHPFDSSWFDVSGADFDFRNYDYRIKPEPREWRLIVSADGRVLGEHPLTGCPMQFFSPILVREVF